MAVLRGERVRQKRNQLQAGAAWSNPDNLVFTNPLGRHLIPNTVYCKFKRIAAALGVADLRFHDLRHTYAVNALHGGDDVKTVQEILSLRTRPKQPPSPRPQYCKAKAPAERNALPVLFVMLASNS